MSVDKKPIGYFYNNSVQFVVLQSGVLDSLQNPIAIAIWAYLCSKPSDWRIWRDDLQSRFSLSRRSLTLALKDLRNAGLLKLSNPVDEKGRRRGTFYSITNVCFDDPNNRGLTDPTNTGNPGPLTDPTNYPSLGLTDTPVNGTPYLYKDNNLVKELNNKEKEKEKILKKKIDSDNFKKFYEAYPRKIAKAPAQKAFDRLSKLDQKNLLDALPMIQSFYANTDKPFIPHPATFINQRRWEDDMESEKVFDFGEFLETVTDKDIASWTK